MKKVKEKGKGSIWAGIGIGSFIEIFTRFFYIYFLHSFVYLGFIIWFIVIGKKRTAISLFILFVSFPYIFPYLLEIFSFGLWAIFGD
ncbi:hypothetical protein HPK19_15700 [Arthrobacter citreus]|nr:hypothetical protein HPK19_15700 [Arthrobacter citreus]